jgi:hypothetical protein
MRRFLIAASLLISPTICSATQVSSVISPKTITAKEQAAAKTRAAADRTTGAALSVEDLALAQLATDKDKPASPEAVCDTLAAAAQAHNLPTPFFIRLIWQESRFKADAVSPVGAQGMAQFMPKTASAMGLDNPFDPLEALPMSAQLLRTLRDQFGNLGLAAAAYNAGPKRVIDWLTKRGPLPKETRDYVEIITGRPAEEWRGSNPVVKINVTVPVRAPCRPDTLVADVHASVPATLNPSIADDIPADPPKVTKLAKSKGKGTKVAETKAGKNRKGKAKVAEAKSGKGRKGKVIVAEISAAKSTKKSAKGKGQKAAAKSGKSGRPMHLASAGKARQ